MKKLIILVCCLFLFGCHRDEFSNYSGISNEEIVKQTKYCLDNNMEPEVIINGLNCRITRIQCRPKREEIEEIGKGK